jgi:hypothetical protein
MIILNGAQRILLGDCIGLGALTNGQCESRIISMWTIGGVKLCACREHDALLQKEWNDGPGLDAEEWKQFSGTWLRRL